MARPVICSPEAFEGVRAAAGRDLLLAGTPGEWVARIGEVLDGRHDGMGRRARAAVEAGHDWSVTMRGLDAALSDDASRAGQEAAA
jgi:hypothetical protein